MLCYTPAAQRPSPERKPAVAPERAPPQHSRRPIPAVDLADLILWIVPIAGLAAVLFAGYLARDVLGRDKGPQAMQDVGDMIRERERSRRGAKRRPDAVVSTDQSVIGKAVTFAEIGPQDACYHQRDKYLNRRGVIIEAQQVRNWLRGTFRFDDPLFPGDDRMYSFLQFRVIADEPGIDQVSELVDERI